MQEENLSMGIGVVEESLSFALPDFDEERCFCAQTIKQKKNQITSYRLPVTSYQ